MYISYYKITWRRDKFLFFKNRNNKISTKKYINISLDRDEKEIL